MATIRMPKPALFTVVAAVLAACGAGITVYEPVYMQTYRDGDLEYAARYGVMRTRVMGMPFGGDRTAFAGQVTAHMKGANRGPLVTYATGPEGTKSGPYHVVMAFDADRAAPAELLCKSPDTVRTMPPGKTAGDRPLRLLAAFCINDDLLSTVEGRAAASGPTAPQFRELVRAVTLSLFPANDYWDDEDAKIPFP